MSEPQCESGSVWLAQSPYCHHHRVLEDANQLLFPSAHDFLDKLDQDELLMAVKGPGPGSHDSEVRTLPAAPYERCCFGHFVESTFSYSGPPFLHNMKKCLALLV